MKPMNTGGGICPLMRKETSKVCHRCELWIAMPVEENGRTRFEHRCSFNWMATLQAIQIGRLDGIQQGTEHTRNAMWEFKETFGAIVAPALLARKKEADNARKLEQQRDADRPARLEADQG